VGVALFGMSAAITLVALEANEVAVLRTFAPGKDVLESRVWVADEAGAIWIEIANPEKEPYRRIVADPHVELVRDGQSERYRAAVDRSPAAHAHVRSLLARKYGLADWWIGLLVDTSHSVAVRLVPGNPGSAATGNRPESSDSAAGHGSE